MKTIAAVIVEFEEWQQAIVHFIAAVPAWRSQVLVGSSAGTFSCEVFLGICWCRGHMAPSQQATLAWKVAAQSGAQRSNRASRHTHAAALFTGALES